MPLTHLFAGIPTRDFATALDWYERLLGRPPDRFPHESEAVWQVAEGGLIYVVADPSRAGGGLVTVIVDDLDLALREWAARDIVTGEIERMAGDVRKVSIIDPDGNMIGVGEVPASPGPPVAQ